MNIQQRIFFSFLFLVLALASIMYTIDFMMSNNLYYVINLCLGLGLNLTSTLWLSGLQQSILNTGVFLLGVPCAGIIMLFIGYALGRKTLLTPILVVEIVIFYLVLFSAVWDFGFTILVFSFWPAQLLTQNVIWLPFINEGSSIVFSWHMGIWFIFFRLMFCLIIGAIIYVNLGKSEIDEEGVLLE